MKTHDKPAETLKNVFRREAASVTRAGASGGHDCSSASQTFILSKVGGNGGLAAEGDAV